MREILNQFFVAAIAELLDNAVDEVTIFITVLKRDLAFPIIFE